MDVKTLCLGLLNSGEACGYDLKKVFESSFKHFFPAGYGSIYPALADLAESGFVSCREIPQVGKPDRKVYRITEQGQQRFLEALNDWAPRHKLRSEFLAMVYFADLMDQEHLRDILDDRLEKLRATAQHVSANGNDDVHDGIPRGAQFVAGFSAVIARAAAEYIECNRHLLTDTADDGLEPAKAAAGR